MTRVGIGAEKEFATVLLYNLEIFSDQIDIDELTSSITSSSTNGALGSLRISNLKEIFKGKGVSPEVQTFFEEIRNVWKLGVKEELINLGKIDIAKARRRSVGSEVIYNDHLTEIDGFLENLAFGIVDGFVLDQVDMVQSVFQQSYFEGVDPLVIAKRIKSRIGLTAQQSVAVDNFRKGLETPVGLRRALRQDLGSDATQKAVREALQRDRGLSAYRITKLTEDYAKRLKWQRALTIAKTETQRIVNAAQNEVWRQALMQGLLPSDTRRYWILSENPCSIYCIPIVELNPNGVPLMSPFASTEGPIWGPPHHPNCKCAVDIA